MNIENVGYGGGGSLLGALLAYVGFKQRLDKLEKSVVYTDTCKVCSDNNGKNFDRIEKKLDMIIEHMIPK